VTYAAMGLAEGTIYTGSARIVGYDDKEYTNSADELITRIDLQVSWGGAWGCPRMDKTCYAKVQGALCEQKDDRNVRQLSQNGSAFAFGKGTNIRNIGRMAEEEDDVVYYDGDGDTEVVHDAEFTDDASTMNEFTDTEYNADGSTGEYIDIEQDDTDGDHEEFVESVNYYADGEVENLMIDEYSENADGVSETEEDVEYTEVNGTDEVVSSGVYSETPDGEVEDEVTEYSYTNNGGGDELTGETVYDEAEDEEGNVTTETSQYDVVDGVSELVEEDDTIESTDDTSGDDDKSLEIEELKEELKEANEENQELVEANEEAEDTVYYEEVVEEVEEEEVDELEDEVEEEYYYNQKSYSFEDDSYEDEYWSGNNWDETWGEYECQNLFDTDFKSQTFDSNTPPGNDEMPFVNIYGKCNSCDAYLIDYFSTEHFNSIIAYKTRGFNFGLAGLASIILTAAHGYRQSKRPRKERELGLIPNENSNVV